MLHADDLLHGDPQRVAAFLGISTRTLRRYKAAPESMPEGVQRLLRLRAEGDLRALGGEPWAGFYLQPTGLFCPMWERNISPETIKGWFFELQELSALRSEVRMLRSALAAREAHPVSFRLVKS